jgi:RNA polymerase sigma-70 factor (ECF subfamily)
MEDEDFIQRCREGDRQAQAELYRCTSEKIYRLLLRMTRSPDDAFDLTQQTYVQALPNLCRFDGRSALSTWLYRIAVNQALRFRHRTAQIQRKTETTPSNEDGASTEHAPDGTKLDVEEALAVLDPRERVILLLRYQEGLSYRAIAEVAECAEGTVGSRLHRARKTLRHLLQKGYGNREETDRAVHQNGEESPLKARNPQE